MRTITRFLDMSAEEKHKQGEQTFTHEAMIDYFIELFNN